MMYQQLLDFVSARPEVYAESSSAFWNDAHISKGMLEAHLAPEWDAATRPHAFVTRSAQWLASLFLAEGARLVDLGCGPGIYAERFREAGFEVTGVDLSPRSIAYARQSAHSKGLRIDYREGDYLTADIGAGYDVATIIYCDFGVLPPASRAKLLARVRSALKPGGALVLDGWTDAYMKDFREGRSVTSEPRGGFWSPKPYLCIEQRLDYPDTRNYLEQSVVVTADDCQCYNIWNQVYDERSLSDELRAAGFLDIRLYGDVAGAPVSGESETLCAVARTKA